MDINQKIDELLAEKEYTIKMEKEAHERVKELDAIIRKLRKTSKDVDEILNPGFVVVSENGVDN